MTSEKILIDLRGHCLICYQISPPLDDQQQGPLVAQDENSDSSRLCHIFLSLISRHLSIPQLEINIPGNESPSTKVGWEHLVKGSLCHNCHELVETYCTMSLERERIKMKLFGKVLEIEQAICLADMDSNSIAAKKQLGMLLDQSGGYTSNEIFPLLERLRNQIRDGVSQRLDERPLVCVDRIGTPTMLELMDNENEKGDSNSLGNGGGSEDSKNDTQTTTTDANDSGYSPGTQTSAEERTEEREYIVKRKVYKCKWENCKLKFFKTGERSSHFNRVHVSTRNSQDKKRRNSSNEFTTPVTAPTTDARENHEMDVSSSPTSSTPTPAAQNKQLVMCCSRPSLTPDSTHNIMPDDYEHETNSVPPLPRELDRLREALQPQPILPYTAMMAAPSPRASRAFDSHNDQTTPENSNGRSASDMDEQDETVSNSTSHDNSASDDEISAADNSDEDYLNSMPDEEEADEAEVQKDHSDGQSTVSRKRKRFPSTGAGDFRIQCGYCERQLDDENDYFYHVQFHRSHPCNFCGMICSGPWALAFHEFKEHGRQRPAGQNYFGGSPMECPRCHEQLSHISHYRNHFFSDHLGVRPTYINLCLICNTICMTDAGFAAHNRKFHPLEEPKKVVIVKPEVPREAKPEAKPEKPAKREGEGISFKCNLCRVPGFSSLLILHEHIRSEHDANMMHCSYCPRFFDTMSKLSNHQEIFHDENEQGQLPVGLLKISPCPYCPMKELFSVNTAAYEEHVEVHLIEEAKRKKRECIICDRVFNSYQALRVHQRIHQPKRKPEATADSDSEEMEERPGPSTSMAAPPPRDSSQVRAASPVKGGSLAERVKLRTGRCQLRQTLADDVTSESGAESIIWRTSRFRGASGPPSELMRQANWENEAEESNSEQSYEECLLPLLTETSSSSSSLRDSDQLESDSDASCSSSTPSESDASCSSPAPSDSYASCGTPVPSESNESFGTPAPSESNASCGIPAPPASCGTPHPPESCGTPHPPESCGTPAPSESNESFGTPASPSVSCNSPVPSESSTIRRSSPAPSYSDISRRSSPAPSYSDISRRSSPAPSYSDISRCSSPAPSDSNISRCSSPALSESNMCCSKPGPSVSQNISPSSKDLDDDTDSSDSTDTVVITRTSTIIPPEQPDNNDNSSNKQPEPPQQQVSADDSTNTNNENGNEQPNWRTLKYKLQRIEQASGPESSATSETSDTVEVKPDPVVAEINQANLINANRRSHMSGGDNAIEVIDLTEEPDVKKVPTRPRKSTVTIITLDD